MTHAFDDLKNGVVLAELGGYGDGPYCGQHGAGAALVMLGTYIVDPGDSVPYPAHFVFKPGRRNYASYLREHVAAGRASGAKVGVSVISIELKDSVDFLVAAEEAGADYASLCAHSEMEMFIQKGLGQTLCHSQNGGLLNRWASAIAHAVNIPVIFKTGFTQLDETATAVEAMAAAGVSIVHLNIESSDAQCAGLRAVGELTGKCGFLIAGGGITDVEDARRVLKAGAGAVAIGSAAMKDPALCGRIQSMLKVSSMHRPRSG
jgi:tRNA-dihydrouridine synthase